MGEITQWRSSEELPCSRTGVEGWRRALARGCESSTGAESLEPGVLCRKAWQRVSKNPWVGWGSEGGARDSGVQAAPMVGRCWWLGCRRPVSLQPCAGYKRVDGIASAEGQPVCQSGY